MYSTANERGYISTDFFVCLSAKCRRDARDPVVSPAFQNRRQFRIANISPGISSDSQAKRLHPRIAGVSPASGCTQPQTSEVISQPIFLIAFRQIAGGTPAIRWSRLHSRIAGNSGSQTFRLVFLQIRRRNACITGSRASRLQAVVLNRK
ncbi:MAG: hypothetical protein LBP59_20790 [Planctomycetaceae bacterium]|nr:hypothetical protein [Planctomycetaceae bacterium]